MPSFAFIFGIDHSRDGAFVDGIFTLKGSGFMSIVWVLELIDRTLVYGVFLRIPFGVHLLLLELGKLSSIVDDHQQLPDEQQG